MAGISGATWVACAGMAVGLASGAAVAGALQNGGFELPLLADGAVQQVTPDSWRWVGQPGFVFNVVGTPGTTAEGQQFVDIGNTPAMGLAQDFTVATSGRYRLTWYDNATAFFQVAPYHITVNGLADLDFDANEGVDAIWNLRSVELDLQASTNYTMMFQPRDIAGPLPAQDRFIDGVSLAAVGTPMPEPASAWLVAAALAGGLVRIRPRRRKE